MLQKINPINRQVDVFQNMLIRVQSYSTSSANAPAMQLQGKGTTNVPLP